MRSVSPTTSPRRRRSRERSPAVTMGQLQVALEKAVRQGGEARPEYSRSSNLAIKAMQTVVEELRAAPDKGAREGLFWGS